MKLDLYGLRPFNKRIEEPKHVGGALNPVVIPLECNDHVPSSLVTKISLVPRKILREHSGPPINVCLMNDSTSCTFCLYSYPTWNFFFFFLELFTEEENAYRCISMRSV